MVGTDVRHVHLVEPGVLVLLEPRRLMSAGDLDPTFGVGGIRSGLMWANQRTLVQRLPR